MLLDKLDYDYMETGAGFEPTKNGFAVRCLDHSSQPAFCNGADMGLEPILNEF